LQQPGKYGSAPAAGEKILPPKGHIGIMAITDKQFGQIEVFYGREQVNAPSTIQQLELF